MVLVNSVVEVSTWMSNYIPLFYMDVITYLYSNLSKTLSVKGPPEDVVKLSVTKPHPTQQIAILRIC